MPSAVLELKGDASGALTAIRQVDRAGARVAASLSAAFRRSSEEMTASARRASLAMARAYQKAAESARDAANAAARVTRRSQQQQTDDAQRGANYRTNSYRREADEARKSADQIARDRERGEQRATRAAYREYQRRAALDRQRAREEAARTASYRRVGAGVAQAVGAAAQFGATAHGLVQDARASRAGTSRTLNQALYQAGAGAGDAAALRAQVYSFARTHGIDAGELASGLNAAQTEFSTLGNARSSQGDRQRNLQGALDTALFARNTGQDVGEVLRVQGMLANSGLDAGAQHSTLLAMTGMAQRGAIELGAVTRTAMAPLQQRVAQSLVGVAPGDTAARNAATQRAVLQTFAEMEVGRSLGMTPRNLGNATAAMESSLGSDVTQQRMLANIRHSNLSAERRRALEEHLFVRDSHGRSRLNARFGSTLGLAQGLTEAGVDTTTAQNIFAGGGHGNPQSLQANWRRTLAAFMGEGGANVDRMLGQSGEFTEADVQRGAGLFGTDDQAQLTRNNEARQTALTENTGALGTLSNRIAEFTAQSPLLTAALGALTTALGGRVAAAAGSGAARLLAAGGAVAAGGGAAGAGVMALGAVAGGALGLGAGELLNRGIDSARGAMGQRTQAQMFGAGNEQSLLLHPINTLTDMFREVRDALTGGEVRVQAVVDPAAAEAARARAAGGASVTPAGGGR